MAEASAERPLRVLHLILMLGETNGQYNEHCLPMVGRRDLSVVTYFEPRLTPPSEIALYAGDGSLRGFFRALRRALDAEPYDVVHAHAPESGVLLVAGLFLWGRIGRVRRSLVYTVQDSFHDYSLRNRALMLFVFPSYRRIVFCSHAARASFPRPWLWLARRRARVVPNAADLDRVERAVAGISRPDAGPFTVISVGRLEPVKDPGVALAAFSAATGENDRMVVVGTGSLAADVVQRAAQLDVAERVRFTGLIDRDDVFRECARADVFVSTSRGEGMPVAVIEAMATGCPVVLSDIPPHRELADGADFIPIVALGDIDGFARAIRRYREMSRAERVEVGRRGRDHVTARYGLPLMHERVSEIYGEVAARDGRPVPA